MEVPLIPFFRQTLPRAAAALFAASLVVSCATSTDTPQAESGKAAVAADVNIERVVLQAYRAIGDRHLFEPNFRTMSAETYRGFASADPALSLETSDAAFTIKRDGREVLTRPAPGDTADGRAWGGLLAELMAGSVSASPALQQTDRQALIREAMTATTKQLDRNSRYADPEEARDNRFQRDGGGGIGITVERTDDKKILIRAVQDGSPSAKAGVQPGDQILAIDGESMTDRTLGDVVSRLRGSVGAPVVLTVLRASQGAELALTMKRSRIIPTTVTYERRGDVALIHLTGFNSATTDNLHAAIDKARADIGKDMAGVIIDMRSNRGGLLDQAQTVSELFLNDGTIFSTQGRHPDSRRIYKSSTGHKAGRQHADRRADERRLGVGRRDRGGGAAGSRPRRRGRHHQLRQGHGPDRGAAQQRGRADPDLVAPAGAVRLHVERARRAAQHLHLQGGRRRPARADLGRFRPGHADALACAAQPDPARK